VRSPPVHWTDYQRETAKFFQSLGYDMSIEETLEGARGKHKVDVVIRFERPPFFKCLWVVECKFWKSNVPKEKVLVLKSIIDDVGADKGIILSEKGFQCGCFLCAKQTNILLRSLSELRETDQVQRLKQELELREAGRINAIANQSILVLMERMAVALGLLTPEKMSDAARVLQIIPKVSPFAGTQFEATIASSDIELSTLLLELRHGLKAAGWIEINQSNLGTIQGEQSSVGDASFVKIRASRDSRLLDAANVLASALNEQKIAAIVLDTGIDIAKENTIHILVGPTF
jgi:hypothetical protein